MDTLQIERPTRTLKLVKTSAGCSRRYATHEKGTRGYISFDPKYGSRRLCSDVWKKYIHPEGSPYFYHTERRLITEANVEIPHVATSIESFWALFRTETADTTFTEAIEIFFCLEDIGETIVCSYYLIDQERGRQFWLDETETSQLGFDMCMSKEHLELQLVEQFWTHVEYFPMHLTLGHTAEAVLKALLSQAIIDQMTSSQSTAPLSATECERIMMVLKNAPSGGSKNWIIARVRRIFARTHFINRWGEFGARLSREQSILLNSETPPSAAYSLVKFFSQLALFNLPELHLSTLERLWVDRVLYGEHWRKYMEHLRGEWRQAIDLSSVLLVLDFVALLLTKEEERYPTFLLAVHASTFLGLGGMFSSMVYLRKYQDPLGMLEDAAIAGLYLEDSAHPILGLQPLAIFNSFPLVLTLWSLLLLFGALCVHTSISLSNMS